MDIFDYMEIDRDFTFPNEPKDDEFYAEQVGLRFKALGLLPADYDLAFKPSNEPE